VHRANLRHLAVSLLVLLATALLASTATALLLDERWWVAELLVNLPIQHALAFALVLVAAALLRHRWLMALSAIGLMLNVAIAAPVLAALWFGEPAPPAPNSATLDVTFFNAKYRFGTLEPLDYLLRRDDEVVVLSLASAGTAAMIDNLPATDLTVRAAPGLEGDDDLEMIALVRDPDADVIVHRPTDEARDAIIEVVLDLEGVPVHVFASHPVSPLTPERAEQRNRSLSRLADRAKSVGGPVIVMGDLNATPWSPRLQELLAAGRLLDSQVGYGLQPSFPAAGGRLGIAIDHILHSPELTTVTRELGPSFDSDHRMVHATFALARRPEANGA
jgi:endonuclease/exonuclease/phosphatase (EEP) superfamily protein YafD